MYMQQQLVDQNQFIIDRQIIGLKIRVQFTIRTTTILMDALSALPSAAPEVNSNTVKATCLAQRAISPFFVKVLRARGS